MSAAPPAAGNEQIKEVQRWLNSAYGLSVDTDGIYGNETRTALTKAMQTELNTQFGADLAVDGIYGPLTDAAVCNVSSGAQGNYTKTLQGFLICNGYDTDGFDGIFGDATNAAVREYQSRQGLAVDGSAGKQTLGTLCG